MKHLYTLLLGASLLAPVASHADEITYSGNTRQYLKYVPADLGEKRPLLISMHGMNQDAGYQKGMLQIESIADTAKFVTVFPEGINRSWDISGTRDINFVLALIDEMERLYDIDKNRVYLSGFSMGGMFTYHAMNHIADHIAAFAPISGYPMGGQPFTSSRPVPIIHTHGTTDDVVDFGGVQRSLDGWIERNGCSHTELRTDEYRYSGCTRHQWGPGEDGAEVVLIERANKGHWIANDVFYTGEEIWNFCKRYSLNAELPKISITKPQADTRLYTIGTKSVFHMQLEAEATSEYADIASVSFYCDNEHIATVNEAPYVYDWSGFSKGDHLLTAVATDVRGTSVARAVPFSAHLSRISLTLSQDFNTDGVLPAGWVGYNGRTLRIGELTDLTGGARVIELTGSPRSFEYGIYAVNSTGKEDKGYVTFGDPRGNAVLMLPAATYEVSFKALSYRQQINPVRCRVTDIETGEVLGVYEVTPTVSLNGSAASPFGDVETYRMEFTLTDDYTYCMVEFLCDDAKGADGVFGSIVLKRKSTDAIETIEATDTKPASVTYYDLLGRQTANPQGIVIRRTVNTDGSTKVEKIIK